MRRYVAACLVVSVLVGACAHQPASMAGSVTTATSAVSFDGNYHGSVALAGVASGIDRQMCAVDPHLSLLVTNNSFTYTQPHPNIAGTSPGITAQATTPIYTATIAPDGSFSGQSNGVEGGTIQGIVSGTHMSGTINGLLCGYKFSAERS